MAYQIYFADLTEENQTLFLAKLREKAALVPQSECPETRAPFPPRQGGRQSFSRRASSDFAASGLIARRSTLWQGRARF